MTDYKQLCAELLDWTRLLIEIPDPPVTRCADYLTDLLARTRAALAEPEPESELRNNTLSTAAYAIVAAAHREGHTNRRGLAAALRAVAEQVGPSDHLPPGFAYSAPAEMWHYEFKLKAQRQIFAIADELEGQA